MCYTLIKEEDKPNTIKELYIMSIKQMRKKITDKYGENNRVVDKFDKCVDDKTKTKKDIDELFEFLKMFFLEGK